MIAGRYRLLSRLGEGGMGTVWRARRLEDGEDVAIKLVKGTTTTPSLARRVVREARAAAAVVHPNVVRVHEVVSTEGAPAIVMELCCGETLAARLERTARLSTAEAAAILIRIAGAVGAAHARGIVHRDLKPANVFLVERADGDDVKVLDFGLAKWIRPPSGSADTAATASGAFLGTPSWMSPEQAFGERDVDHRTDLWSLGIIAYQCLSGVLPTRAANLGQVLKIVLQSKIRPLSEVAREVPAALASLVDALLRPERGDRPADMRDVVNRLEAHTPVRVPTFDAPDAAPRVTTDGVEDEEPVRGDVATLDPSVPPSRRAPSAAAAPAADRASRRVGTIVAASVPLALVAVIALALRSPGGTRAIVDGGASSPPGDPAPTAVAVAPPTELAAPVAAAGDVAVRTTAVEPSTIAAMHPAARASRRDAPSAASSSDRIAVPSARPLPSTQPAPSAPAPPSPPADSLWPTEFGP